MYKQLLLCVIILSILVVATGCQLAGPSAQELEEQARLEEAARQAEEQARLEQEWLEQERLEQERIQAITDKGLNLIEEYYRLGDALRWKVYAAIDGVVVAMNDDLPIIIGDKTYEVLVESDYPWFAEYEKGYRELIREYVDEYCMDTVSETWSLIGSQDNLQTFRELTNEGIDTSYYMYAEEILAELCWMIDEAIPGRSSLYIEKSWGEDCKFKADSLFNELNYALEMAYIGLPLAE